MFHELERSLDRGRMTIHASPTPNNERYWKDNENNDQTVRQQYKDDFEENNFDTCLAGDQTPQQNEPVACSQRHASACLGSSA